MKIVYLILILGLSMPGCSRLSKSERTERAYYKSLKVAKKKREKQRDQMLKHQRAPAPTLRTSPPPVEETVQPAPESQ